MVDDQIMRQQEANANESDGQPGLDLQRMLETLDEEDRALLILKYAEGYSYEDLSEMFHLSVSACKMRVSRARGRIRKQYPKEME